MNPLCQAEGVGLVPWSLLARGFLAGNRQRQGGPDHRGDQAISSGAKPGRP
jgi:aryl-alcohol dehydrogenase (NADP+)